MTLVWLILAPIAFAAFGAWFVGQAADQDANPADIAGPLMHGLVGRTEAELVLDAGPDGLPCVVGEVGGVAVEVGMTRLYSANTVATGAMINARRGGRRAAMYVAGVQARLRIAQLPAGISVGAEGLGSRLDRAVGWGDVSLGDDAFDGHALLAGPEDELLARLDDETRRAFGPALDEGWSLRDGVMARTWRGSAADGPDVVSAIEAALPVARLLARPVLAVDLALAVRAAQDPSPDVRARALAVLLRDHPDSRYVDQAVATALEGSSGSLVDALEATETEALAAAWRLAAEGEARHVAPLRAAARRSDDLAHVCRRALDAIQARLDPSRAGGLAIAEGDARGGLSTSDREWRGAVSEAPGGSSRDR